MKQTLKTSGSFILIIIFLIACIFVIFGVFAAAWLHTYRVFTTQDPVAELVVSELKEDEKGEYFEVTIKQIKGRSPLAAIFNPYDETDDVINEEQTFKLYGDEISIGGPTIRFKDYLTLLNLKTVYKLAFVEGVYTNTDRENERTPDMTRRFDLNGGYETWRKVFEDVREENIRGKFISLFIDNLPQVDPERIFVDKDDEMELTLCVTEEGFVFCER
jgi:hypothetical protein